MQTCNERAHARIHTCVKLSGLHRAIHFAMGASMLQAGCMFIAYAPSVVLLLAYASKRSALLLLTVGRYARAHGGTASVRMRWCARAQPGPLCVPCSAFAWLFAILLAGVVWIAIPPLRVRSHPPAHGAPSHARGGGGGLCAWPHSARVLIPCRQRMPSPWPSALCCKRCCVGRSCGRTPSTWRAAPAGGGALAPTPDRAC
ncbi:hypothetical protein EON67_04255 [archaeon]|nr:MAG: hypothetical protein EON67_04255 [archaeon]